MTKNDYFNSEKALNISGILVISIIGALAVYTERNSPIWPLVAFLAIAMLIGFIIFLRSETNVQRYRIFWILALLISAMFFAVELDVVAILTIVWIGFTQ